MTRPGATRDPRGHRATFTSGSYPRPSLEWEPEPTFGERVTDAFFVLAFAALGCLAGWGLWVGFQRVLDWWAL